jgi:hypothetical protein
MTPTVQALEAKVMTLKRAIKVKNEDDEATLEDLTRKWRNAGQEVAYELFQLIKENMDDEGNWMSQNSSTSKKRKFEDSWGWQDSSGSSKAGRFENSWGWDEASNRQETEGHTETVTPEEREQGEQENPEQTLGLMLRQLGIDPKTLGWNEADEVFVD